MASAVIAGPLGDHCFTAVQHVGTPVGQIVTIAGVETYVSAPLKGNGTYDKIILFYADVFSPLYINNKLIQDYFASNGYLVLGPDYFLGDPVQDHDGEEGFDRAAWFAKARANTEEVLPKWIQAVKETYGVTGVTYHSVGYCFGAPYVFQDASSDWLTSGAVAHPSLLNEDHFNAIKKPLFFSCAEIDHTFPLDKRRRAEDILIGLKATYHFQVFSGVAHGFAVRGDPNVENTRWAKEQSAQNIIGWFDRFSKSSTKSHL
ncbi:hypothetical protein ONZ45_g3976 [Pleurotus djamor]|nr:hypothetical protein ONZ45_g3976 [Pleurotus djamor]